MREEEKRWEELAGDAMVSSPEENWQEGEIATIDFLRQTGKIISLDFKKKEALVEVEGRKVKTSFSHLEKMEKKKTKKMISLPPRLLIIPPCPGLKTR